MDTVRLFWPTLPIGARSLAFPFLSSQRGNLTVSVSHLLMGHLPFLNLRF